MGSFSLGSGSFASTAKGGQVNLVRMDGVVVLVDESRVSFTDD